VERLAPVVVVSNQKGGVGKTTTVVNLAAYAGLAGLQVIVVDSDLQANATSGLTTTPYEHSIYTSAEAVPTSADGVRLVPAGSSLPDQVAPLAHRPVSELRNRIQPLRSQADLILIDCPPNLTLLPTNALVAATHLLVPLQSEYFALEGLSQLLAHVDALRQDHQLNLELCGILLTMATPGSPLSRSVEAEVRRHFTQGVFNAVIPRDESAAAAPSHAKALVDHDPLAPSALAYLAATRELLQRLSLAPRPTTTDPRSPGAMP
jgi:chromosome partitioning protein